MNTSLKILHVSDGALPDSRIEKAAINAKNRRGDMMVYFAGLKCTDVNNTFDKKFDIHFDYYCRIHDPFMWKEVKKQLLKIIKEVKPDLIHAHDVFAGKMCMEIVSSSKEDNNSTSVKMVYDSHEFWLNYVKHQYKENKSRNNKSPKYRAAFDKWIEWEYDLIMNSGIPVITPSKKIKEKYDEMMIEHDNNSSNSSKTFVIPNYPMRGEIKDIPEPVEHDPIDSVFTNNNKPYKGIVTPIVNVDGFLDLFYFTTTNKLGKLNIIGWRNRDTPNIKYHGYIDTKEGLFKQLSKSDIGIIPWHPHPHHEFCSPNRAYEYIHAGLLVLAPKTLTSLFSELKEHAVYFETYDDLVKLIRFFREHPDILYNRRRKAYRHARDKLIWENYENNLFDAYNKSL